VDQLSAWVAASRWPELPDSGGFARLRREGTWVQNLRYPYAVTDTAPGHAALHTGAVPADSGITSNEIPSETRPGRLQPIVQDANTQLVLASGISETPGASAKALQRATVADRLREAHSDALVVSVSLKDRAAVLSAGQHPTHALWFNVAADAFVTSTAYANAFPAWARGIGDRAAIEAARKPAWTIHNPAWLAAHATGIDAQPGEGNLDGLGNAFPHVPQTAAAFRATPASDRVIIDLALASIDALYKENRPTLLLLSLSASDIIGHVFGPDSWEAWDHLYALDQELGRLIDALEKKSGTSSVSVLLAADHGNVSMPEIPREKRTPHCQFREPNAQQADPYRRPCTGGVRLSARALERELIAATSQELGTETLWVAGVADPYVFLTPDAKRLSEPKRAQLDATIQRVLAKYTDAIEQTFDARTLAAKCPSALTAAPSPPARARAEENLLVLVCRSWTPSGKAGDMYIALKPGSFFESDITPGHGSSHGSPHLFDRTVPMLVRGPGIQSGRVISDTVDFSAFAALESALLGLDSRSPGDVLNEYTAR